MGSVISRRNPQNRPNPDLDYDDVDWLSRARARDQSPSPVPTTRSWRRTVTNLLSRARATRNRRGSWSDDDASPQLCDLVLELKGVSWYKLGIQLQVPVDKLDKIEDDHRDSDKRLSKVLQYWLDNEADPSWEKICDVLQRMGEHARLVRQLIVKYCPLNTLHSVSNRQHHKRKWRH